MHIVEANAEGFLRAFHGQQSEMIVAVLILTVRRRDLELFKSLLEGVAEIDQALGKEIGLFLFHPGPSSGLVEGNRGRSVLPGERLNGPAPIGPKTRANNFYQSLATFPRQDVLGDIRANLVAQSTANIVQDFSIVLELENGDLPCVCTLIQGVPGAIICRAGDRLSYDAIVRVAEVLRPQADEARRQWDGLAAQLPEMRQAIVKLEAIQVREQKLRSKILELAAALERSHNIVLQPQLTAMLANNTLTPARADALVKEVAGEKADKVLASSRTQGIRSRAAALLEIGDEMHALASGDSERRFAHYSDRVEETRLALKRAAESAFAEAGISVWRYRDTIGRLAKTSQMLATAAKAINLLRRASLPFP